MCVCIIVAHAVVAAAGDVSPCIYCLRALRRYQRLRRESEMRIKKLERDAEETSEQHERERKHHDKKVRTADVTFVDDCTYYFITSVFEERKKNKI